MIDTPKPTTEDRLSAIEAKQDLILEALYHSGRVDWVSKRRFMAVTGWSSGTVDTYSSGSAPVIVKRNGQYSLRSFYEYKQIHKPRGRKA